MSNPDDPRTWMNYAEMDLLCIDNNLQAPCIPWGAVAFHAQQAAEKALKAVLVSLRLEVPRTHDLSRLLAECAALEAGFAVLADDCALLTPHAVAIRYPGEDPQVGREESLAAVAAGKRVHALAKGFLSSCDR